MFGDSLLICRLRLSVPCRKRTLSRKRPRYSAVESKFAAVQQDPQDAAVTFPVVLAPRQVALHQLDLLRRRAARQHREVESGHSFRVTRLGVAQLIDDRSAA